MADNETVADIIAEMRGMGNYQRYSGDHARVLADRLEAAHRRERGDVAKLREACANIAAYARLAQCHATDAHILGYLSQIEMWACAALAAPMRNCDRFTSAEEAFHAWNNTVDTPGGGAYVGLMDWLFAPATEKEGANDGNE